MTMNAPVDKQSAAYQQNKLKSAQYTLLIAVLFTVLNVVLLLIGTNRYFLYSATIPYYLTFFGYMFDHFTLGTYALTGLVLAAVPVAALALCWFMSKKDSRWLKGALAIFVLDTAAMVGLMLWTGQLSSSLLDIVFHVWMLISLTQGIKAAGRLKILEAEAANVPQQTEEVICEETPEENDEELSETENLDIDTDCPV